MDLEWDMEAPFTLLHRPGSNWSQEEIMLLWEKLQRKSTVYSRADHPTYLILGGHHMPERLRQLIPADPDFTVTQVNGGKNAALPFGPFLGPRM